MILVDEGPSAGHVVFDDGKGPPITVAKSLAHFVSEWAQHGLRIEAIIPY